MCLFIARMIEKYGDEVLEEIRKEEAEKQAERNNSTEIDKSVPS